MDKNGERGEVQEKVHVAVKSGPLDYHAGLLFFESFGLEKENQVISCHEGTKYIDWKNRKTDVEDLRSDQGSDYHPENGYPSHNDKYPEAGKQCRLFGSIAGLVRIY